MYTDPELTNSQHFRTSFDPCTSCVWYWYVTQLLSKLEWMSQLHGVLTDGFLWIETGNSLQGFLQNSRPSSLRPPSLTLFCLYCLYTKITQTEAGWPRLKNGGVIITDNDKQVEQYNEMKCWFCKCQYPLQIAISQNQCLYVCLQCSIS